MSSDDAVVERNVVTSSPSRIVISEKCHRNFRFLPAYNKRHRRRRQRSRHDGAPLASDDLSQEQSPLLIHDDNVTSNADVDINCSDTDTTVAAHRARHLSDVLEWKLNQQAAIDPYKLYVTSSHDRDGPQRFWSPSLDRRRENVRPHAWASMFDFRSDKAPNFRSKSPSTAASTLEIPEADTETSRKESVVARHCTRQLCCEYFRKFVAFLFSTIGSCCLMVGYVILGGVIFQHLEAEHGRVVDVDMQRVKDRHVRWLWNLTAAMNVLHPRNWSTTAFDVLDSYTSEVVSATKNYNWDGKNRLEQQWTFAGAMLYSVTVITTIADKLLSVMRDVTPSMLQCTYYRGAPL